MHALSSASSSHHCFDLIQWYKPWADTSLSSPVHLKSIIRLQETRRGKIARFAVCSSLVLRCVRQLLCRHRYTDSCPYSVQCWYSIIGEIIWQIQWAAQCWDESLSGRRELLWNSQERKFVPVLSTDSKWVFKSLLQSSPVLDHRELISKVCMSVTCANGD